MQANEYARQPAASAASRCHQQIEISELKKHDQNRPASAEKNKREPPIMADSLRFSGGADGT